MTRFTFAFMLLVLTGTPSSAVPAATFPAATTTARMLNVRAGIRGEVRATLPQGTVVILMGERDGWHQVQLANGGGGWICGDHFALLPGPAGPIPSPERPVPVALPVPVAVPEPAGRVAPFCGPPTRGACATLQVKTTGYYPPPTGGYRSRVEARREGGATGAFGKLRTLQSFDARVPGAYVSCATDPRLIRTGTTFTIDQYPGVAFLACDTGGKVKGAHVDICVEDRIAASRVTGKATIRFAR